MKLVITGSAGFIGSALALKLLKNKHKILGIDNHNNYYDPKLKEDRYKRLIKFKNYSHYRVDLGERKKIDMIFKKFKPDCVVNLAAQAGVRYSIENPMVYIGSNIVGFVNLLEASKKYKIKHFVYASSSSVYGSNTSMPFSIHDNVDHPISLYAATKKSNELISHAYSHLFNLPTTGLRFFTVYGPWGRPDMALFKFTKSILKGKKIEIYNYGKHQRDFTYIDDIVEGVIKVIKSKAKRDLKWNSKKPDPGTSIAPWRLYNIGSNNPVNLMDYITFLEKALGKKAKKKYLKLQPGDVEKTYADVSDLVKDFKYRPKTSVKNGVQKFVEWYLDYYSND